MTQMVHLYLVASTDKTLDCIVCRRNGIDREIVYGINGGRASQGLHAKCAGRLQAIRPNRGIRRRSPGQIEKWARQLAADVAELKD